MKHHLVQLLVSIPEGQDMDPPFNWDWDNMINPSSGGDIETPVTVLSSTGLAEYIVKAFPVPQTTGEPEFFPKENAHIVGTARFNGQLYDAVAQEGCDGCAFEDTKHTCENTRCNGYDNPFKQPVIYLLHKD